jgi:hypothetical protein
MFLKNGMPTGLSISLFEMPTQTEEENMLCNVPSDYSKQIGAGLCVQVVGNMCLTYLHW